MSTGNAAAVAISLVGGIAGTVQIAVMGRFGDRIGVVPAFAFATAVTAALSLVLLLVARRSLAGYSAAVHSPAWMWVGGLMGAIIVLGITFAAPRIGTTATIALIITGNVLMGTAIDRFGLLGVDAIPLAWPRVVGIALLAVGAALSLYRP